MRHPWRFYPASAGQSTAASKGDVKSKTEIQIRAFGANGQISTDNSQQQ